LEGQRLYNVRRIKRTLANSTVLVPGAQFQIKIVALAALCAGVGLHVQWQAYRNRRNAEVLLAGLRRLKVGESTVDDVQQLIRDQQQFVGQNTPFCHDEFCTYTFGYGNYDSTVDIYVLRSLQLWRFHLVAAPVALSADLLLRHNRLVQTSMLLDSQVSANVLDEVPDISPVKASYLVENSRPTQTTIYIKPSATVAQRESAYSFNLKCLDRLGGCTEKSQLFQNPL
jgi:hypothetical protein